jgi:hypothetical protein
MNVSYQLKQVDILLAQDRFKAILEKVAMSAVRSIVPLGVAGQKTTHDSGDRHRSCSQKKVKVIGNQRPCITEGLRLLENFPKSFQKVVPVRIATKHCPTFNSPDHDVVQGTSSIDSRSPWHPPPLPLRSLLRQVKNLTASPFKGLLQRLRLERCLFL